MSLMSRQLVLPVPHQHMDDPTSLREARSALQRNPVVTPRGAPETLAVFGRLRRIDESTSFVGAARIGRVGTGRRCPVSARTMAVEHARALDVEDELRAETLAGVRRRSRRACAPKAGSARSGPRPTRRRRGCACRRGRA